MSNRIARCACLQVGCAPNAVDITSLGDHWTLDRAFRCRSRSRLAARYWSPRQTTHSSPPHPPLPSVDPSRGFWQTNHSLTFIATPCTASTGSIIAGYELFLLTSFWVYRVIHKSLQDFRTRMRNNQDRHGRKGISIGRESLQVFFCTRDLGLLPGSTARG